MVQEVKRCLRKALRNAKLDYDELHTVLVEIESTLNSRPLTYVSSDELDEPITPSLWWLAEELILYRLFHLQ